MGFSLGGSGRGIRFLDALMLIWVFTWVALGIAVFQEVGNLRQLSDTEVAAGRAIVQTGNALQPLEQLPLVGGRIGSVRQQVIAAGRSAEQSGEASRQTVGQLSILLGLSVGLIPTVPAFAIYGPLRLSWVRDVRAVRRTLAKHRGEVTVAAATTRGLVRMEPTILSRRGRGASPWVYPIASSLMPSVTIGARSSGGRDGLSRRCQPATSRRGSPGVGFTRRAYPHRTCHL
jgi:hypothetical protein